MDFRLRPATPADYPAIVEIINSSNSFSITVTDMTREDELFPKADPRIRLVVEVADGTIVGTGSSAGGSLFGPGLFSIKVRTATPYRRQGIGEAVLQALEQFAREHGATRLESDVREIDADAVTWAERHGYQKEHHMFQSTLTMSNFDQAAWSDPVTQARDQGIRFTTLQAELDRTQDETTREQTFFRFLDMMWELSGDTPDGHGGRPKPPLAMMKQAMLGDAAWSPARVFLALDGDRWAAVASLVTVDNGGLYHQFTGVDRNYRGRGLSLAIKLVAMEYAKAQGAAFVRTNNHSANAPMLATNRKLGYVPEPGIFRVAKLIAR